MRKRSQADSVPAELRLKILKRDGWRCQACGSMRQLEVHHQTLRSQGGGPGEDNLITLCRTCHGYQHGATVVSSPNC